MATNKRILVVCPYPQGFAPSQRLKYEQYFPHFESVGYNVEVASFMTPEGYRIAYTKSAIFKKILTTLSGYLKRVALLFKLPFYDIVYVHLWVTPFGFPVFEFLYSVLSKKIVYDIDDLVFLDNESVANSWVSKFKGKQKPIFLMKHAAHVITCTPFLDNFTRQFNKNTTDISSTVNTDTYIPINNYTNDHTLIIGWSGSHSTAKYLLLLRNVFIALKKKYDIEIVAMGAADFTMDGVEIKAIPWSEASEIPVIQQFDIGVYPLPDEQWVHGKSGLKAIQYMALGIPTVASKVGEAIKRVIDDDQSGFIASTDEEWIEKLSMLIEDAALRKRLGETARKKVVDKFSIEANKNNYLSIFETVLKQGS